MCSPQVDSVKPLQCNSYTHVSSAACSVRQIVSHPGRNSAARTLLHYCCCFFTRSFCPVVSPCSSVVKDTCRNRRAAHPRPSSWSAGHKQQRPELRLQGADKCGRQWSSPVPCGRQHSACAGNMGAHCVELIHHTCAHTHRTQALPVPYILACFVLHVTANSHES